MAGTRYQNRRVIAAAVPDAWNVAVAAQSPFLWYKFEEASGNLVNSGSAGVYSVVASALTTTKYQAPGTVGATSAIEFHGEYYEAVSALTYQATGSYSVLVKPYQFGRRQWILGWFQAASSTGNKLYMETDGTLVLWSAGGGARTRQTTIALNKGEWNHIVVTNDGVSLPSVYINGVLETTYSDVGATPAAGWWMDDYTPNRFGFGHNVGDETGYEHERFIGKIDDFFYVDGTALSAATVTALYASSLIPTTTQARENFEEAIGYYTPSWWLSFNDITTLRNFGVTSTNSATINNSALTLGTTVTTNADGAAKGVTSGAAAGFLTFNQRPFPNAAGGGNTGAVFFVFKANTDKTQAHYFLDFVRPSGATGRITISRRATTGFIDIFCFYTASTVYRYWIFSTDLCDGLDHVIALVQRGDGTGVHCFIDGVEDAVSDTNFAGGTPPGVNTWFADIADSGSSNGMSSYALLALNRPTQNYARADVDHASAVFGYSFSDAEIAAISALL